MRSKRDKILFIININTT